MWSCSIRFWLNKQSNAKIKLSLTTATAENDNIQQKYKNILFTDVKSMYIFRNIDEMLLNVLSHIFKQTGQNSNLWVSSVVCDQQGATIASYKVINTVKDEPSLWTELKAFS